MTRINTRVPRDFYLPMCHLHTFTGGIPIKEKFKRIEVERHISADEEQKNQIKFRTYYNYLLALNSCLPKNDSEAIEIIRDVSMSDACRSIQVRKSNHNKDIEKRLRIAWMNEISLNQSGSNEDCIPYANQWVCVQAYYSLYAALRAFFISIGVSVLDTHTESLRTISEQIKCRPGLFPFPWKILCLGDPEQRIYEGISGGNINHGHSPLEKIHKENATDSIAKFLKTTRTKIAKKKIIEWKRQNKTKRILASHKERVLANLYATSLFDGMYRLRIRSNYEDADIFFHSVMNNKQAFEFYDSLRNLTSNGLLTLEFLLAKHISRQSYESIITGFQKNYDKKNQAQDLCIKRWELIKKGWN